MKFDKAGQGLREAAKASGKIGASVRDVMNNTGKEDSDASDMTLSSFRKAQSDAQGAAREIFEAVRRRKVRSDIQKRTENEKVLLNTYRSTDSVDAAMNNAKAKAWRKSKDDKIVMEDRRQTTAARQSETGQADVSKGKAAADKKAASQVGAKDRKRNFAARLAARRAAKKSAEKAGTEIAKNAAKGAAAGTAKAAKKGIAAAITSNPVSLIILLIFAVIFIVVMMLTVSSFMGQASAMIAEQMGALQYLNTAVIAEIQDKVNDEWYNELYRTRQQYSDMGVPYQNISVRYNHDVEGDSGGRRISNWSDVFAVWLIKNDRTITADDYTAIRDIYFAMNPITVTTEAVTDEELPEEIPEEEVSPEAPEPPEEETPITPEDTLVYIDVRNLSYQQMAGIYNLSSADMAQIDEWLNPTSETSGLWYSLLGAPVDASDDYSGLYTTLNASPAVSLVLEEAARREGWIYSNDRRGTPGYDDCSSFAWGCYMAAGIDLGDSSYPPTAAEQARWCDEHNCRVSPDALQPGDLIFWAGKNNGRYLNIYHVAIYVGDGKMWESAPSAGGVIFRDVSIQNPSKILFYARPTAAK